MKKIIYSSLILLCVCFVTSAKSQLPEDFTNRLQHVLDSVCMRYNIKGTSAAVLIPNVGIWKGVHGESYTDHPITPDMILGIMSNTKTYTSTLMLKLQEMGKVDLDDTIGTWIHDIPNVNGQITIRQLLNHTSGIGDYDYSEIFSDSVFSDLSRTWQPEELLKFPITAPHFAPGKGWYYSNTNYVIAGYIIKLIMNQPISKTFRDLIFDPQGLKETIFFSEETSSAPSPHIWTSHSSLSKNQVDLMEAINYQNNSEISSGYTAGAIMTTAEENAIFWHKLISGEIINKSSLEQMMEYVQLQDPDWKYGLGIYRGQNDINGRVVYEHGGYGIGFATENAVDSASGVCITVLTNQDSITNDILLLDVVAALHKVTLQIPADANEGINVTPTFSIAPNPVENTLHLDTYFEEPRDYIIYNAMGVRVKTGKLNHEIYIADLPSGTYFLQIENVAKPLMFVKVQ